MSEPVLYSSYFCQKQDIVFHIYIGKLMFFKQYTLGFNSVEL